MIVETEKKGFNFTNEQIVYIYTHFNTYLETIKSQVDRQLKMSQGQLNLAENIYGNDADFDRDTHDLYNRLLNVEIPKLINERCSYMEDILSKFRDSYELISDVTPELVDDVKSRLFSDSESITDIIEQLKDKENGNND